MASPTLHPTAVVAEGARIGDGATIGPYCVIGPKAEIGSRVELSSHIVIEGRTQIKSGAKVGPFTTLGMPAQHLAARTDDTELLIEEDAFIGEQVSIHRGTDTGRGITTIEKGAYVMAAVHIGHDCCIGEDSVIGSNASFGGHCTVEEGVFIGGLAAFHQRVRIGAYSIVGGASAVEADVIPFGAVAGNRAKLIGLNLVGMKRRSFSRDKIRSMRNAYKTLFMGDGKFADRLSGIEKEYANDPDVMRIVGFINAKRARSLLGPEKSSDG
ncbi:MAG: acyl-ACP--UDP-N-acetylglucosamine O-acyltransferase [Pseudomonadota bacterium]